MEVFLIKKKKKLWKEKDQISTKICSRGEGGGEGEG